MTAQGESEFEQPTMNCPRCKKEYDDLDGVGVLYCPRPNRCGYCRHAACSGQDDGSWKCDFCGDVDKLAIAGRMARGHVVCVDQDDTPANREAMARRGYKVEIKPWSEAYAELQVCIAEHKCKGPVPAPASGWQSERPTRGNWWLSILPEKRSGSAVVAVVVDGLGFAHKARSMRVLGNIKEGLFIGSKWKRRETPADPFKVSGADSRPTGGHWESKRGEFHGLDSKPGDVWVPGEEFRSGMPSAELRAVHEHWQDNYGHPWRFLSTDKPTAILNKGKFRPWKSTWAAVEMKAASSQGGGAFCIRRWMSIYAGSCAFFVAHMTGLA